MKSKILLLVSFILLGFYGNAQTKASPSIFPLLYSGKKKVQKKLTITDSLQSLIFLKGDTIFGKSIISKDVVYLKNNSNTYTVSFNDTGFHKLILFTNTDSIEFKKVSINKKEKLLRILYSKSDFTIYDDPVNFKKEIEYYIYDNMVFEYKNTTYPVFDFWNTSTKKRIVNLINTIFSGDLKYDEYRNKTDLLNSILNNSNRIISKK